MPKVSARKPCEVEAGSEKVVETEEAGSVRRSQAAQSEPGYCQIPAVNSTATSDGNSATFDQNYDQSGERDIVALAVVPLYCLASRTSTVDMDNLDPRGCSQ